MMAFMGLLQLLHHTPLNQRQRDLADRALGAARSLLGVVNDILDYSKAEAGKMALDPQPFESDALFSELSALLSSTLGDKPLDLVFDIDPQLPRALQGDSLRLRQVLINLGVNAIRFTERGEVVLRVQVLERHGETVRLALEVRDTGVGLTAEQRQRLFQPGASHSPESRYATIQRFHRPDHARLFGLWLGRRRERPQVCPVADAAIH